MGDDKKEEFDTQTDDPGAWVGVRAGHHEKTDEDVTDIVIQDKETGDHTHIGFTLDGNEAFRVDK
jgi:hypothetical protein